MLTKIKNIKLRKETKNQKGFTLVELMATLGILALIVAIAVPAIGSIMTKAGDSAEQADYDMIADSANIAYASEGNQTVDNIFDKTGEPMTVSVDNLISSGYLDIELDNKESIKGTDTAKKAKDKPFVFEK